MPSAFQDHPSVASGALSHRLALRAIVQRPSGVGAPSRANVPAVGCCAGRSSAARSTIALPWTAALTAAPGRSRALSDSAEQWIDDHIFVTVGTGLRDRIEQVGAVLIGYHDLRQAMRAQRV